jgi:hypothetical protein
MKINSTDALTAMGSQLRLTNKGVPGLFQGALRNGADLAVVPVANIYAKTGNSAALKLPACWHLTLSPGGGAIERSSDLSMATGRFADCLSSSRGWMHGGSFKAVRANA